MMKEEGREMVVLSSVAFNFQHKDFVKLSRLKSVDWEGKEGWEGFLLARRIKIGSPTTSESC